MHKVSHFAKIGLAASLMLSGISGCKCEKTFDTASNQGFVAYTFDWKNIQPGFPVPQTLRYCFYPSGNGAMIQMDSDNMERMRVALPIDQYKVIIFNCDNDVTPVRNTKQFDESEAFLPTVSFTDAIEKARSDRNPLYAIVIDTLQITPKLDKEIRLIPEPLTRTIDIKINIGETNYIKECRGSLSGVVTALNLSTRRANPDCPTTVTFQTQQTDKGIEGKAIVLGIADREGKEGLSGPPPQITLDFTFTDGTTASSTMDIGNQLIAAGPGTEPIHIEIDALLKHKPAFSVVFNSWKTELRNLSAMK